MLFLLTQHCTMGCKHCMSRSTPESPHASRNTVEAFIKFAKKIGTNKICISGGEPTSHPHFIAHFKSVLENFPNALISLMSNGQFFKNERLTLELAALQRINGFTVQICSIKELYPEYLEIIPLIIKYSSIFKDFLYVDKLNTLETRLGRASENNVLKFSPGKPRAASSCFNLYNISRHMRSLKETIQLLDERTNFNFCKPMIDALGNIHPGESIDCKIIGNVHKLALNKMHRILSTTEPCGKCGNPITLDKVLGHPAVKFTEI